MISRALIAEVVVLGFAQAQAPNTVTMQSVNARDILYMVAGGGANSLALMRDDGVVLIDSKTAEAGPAIAEAIRGVSDAPVKVIINTNSDADHAGGNGAFPTAARIIAHQVVADKLSLLDGLDRIDVYYFGRGHTDGDLVVVFPEKHVAYFGDLFPAKAAPVIDTARGGSGVAFPETLAKAISEIKGVTQVIPGHYAAAANPKDVRYLNFAATMTWGDLQEYADFNRDFLAAVQNALKAGKSADEAATALKLPDKYRAYDMRQAKANVQAIYSELGR
jgi:glyoxylase-like metal-dependent hydrolase (beta-lactamase superfamily II)